MKYTQSEVDWAVKTEREAGYIKAGCVGFVAFVLGIVVMYVLMYGVTNWAGW